MVETKMISKSTFRNVLRASLLLMLIVAGCKHVPQTADILPDSGTGGILPPDTTLFEGIPCDPDSAYFENQILPLLVSSCAQPGCHDAATAEDGVILDSYSNILSTGDVELFDPEDSDIYEVITDDDPDDMMPPEGEDPLTQDQIDLIYTWISQGAANNSCASCDTTDVTFSGAVYPIVEIKCQGCHSGDNPSAGLHLETYADIEAIASEGSLMSSLLGTNSYTLMPYNSNQLPPCELQVIESWIDNGAPND